MILMEIESFKLSENGDEVDVKDQRSRFGTREGLKSRRRRENHERNWLT